MYFLFLNDQCRICKQLNTTAGKGLTGGVREGESTSREVRGETLSATHTVALGRETTLMLTHWSTHSTHLGVRNPQLGVCQSPMSFRAMPGVRHCFSHDSAICCTSLWSEGSHLTYQSGMFHQNTAGAVQGITPMHRVHTSALANTVGFDASTRRQHVQPQCTIYQQSASHKIKASNIIAL